MTPDTPLLAAAKGRVDFSQRGFTVSGASARTLGGEIAFEGGSSAGLSGGDSQRFSGRGTVTAEALRQATELGTIARLAPGARRGRRAIGRRSRSSPAGRRSASPATWSASAIDLPAPLAKAAATPLAAARSHRARRRRAVPADGAATFREALQVDLGGALQAHFVREASGDAARVVRGAIRVAEARAAATAPSSRRRSIRSSRCRCRRPASPPTSNLKRLDVEAWQAALARVQGDGRAPARRRRRRAPAAPLVFDAARRRRLRARRDRPARRRARRRLAPPRQRHRRACRSRPSSGAPTSSADELEGYVEYRPARRGARRRRRRPRVRAPVAPEPAQGRGRARREPARRAAGDDARRSTSSSTTSSCAASASAGSRSRRPTAPPAIATATREWQLAKLNLTMPEAQLTATGTWGDAAAPAPARRGARR